MLADNSGTSWKQPRSGVADLAAQGMDEPCSVSVLEMVTMGHISLALLEECKRVVGHGHTAKALLEGYHERLPVFGHLLRALLVQCEPALREQKTTGHAGEPDQPVHTCIGARADSLLAVSARNLERGRRVYVRLRKQDKTEAFHKTPAGAKWASASLGFFWAIFGFALLAQDPERSETDVAFCEALLVHGPRDAYRFVRGYELDQRPSVDPPPVGAMPRELESLDASEHVASERLLHAVDP